MARGLQFGSMGGRLDVAHGGARAGRWWCVSNTLGVGFSLLSFSKAWECNVGLKIRGSFIRELMVARGVHERGVGARGGAPGCKGAHHPSIHKARYALHHLNSHLLK